MELERQQRKKSPVTELVRVDETTSINCAQCHRAAKQKKLLTKRFCIEDFFGYQPNFHLAGSLFYIA